MLTISTLLQALLIAEATEPYRSSIAKQCRRLVRSSLILQSSFHHFLRELDSQIFFATPHRASTIGSSWEDLLFNILLASRTTSLSMSMTYATQLKTFSIFIQDVSDKFTHLSPRHLINVYQQYDESKSSSPVGFQTMLAEASLGWFLSPSRLLTYQGDQPILGDDRPCPRIEYSTPAGPSGHMQLLGLRRNAFYHLRIYPKR